MAMESEPVAAAYIRVRFKLSASIKQLFCHFLLMPSSRAR